MASIRLVVQANRIPAFSAALQEQAVEVVANVTVGIQAQAAMNAPIRTGQLARSIRANVRQTGNGATGEVTVGAEYGAYVEFGTGQRGAGSSFPGKPTDVRYTPGWPGMSARPFLTPAVEAMRDEWEQEWGTLRRALRKAGM